MVKKHISQKKLDEVLRKEKRSLGQDGVLSKIRSMRNEFPSGDKRTVFLSHSHHDKTIVNKIGLLFNQLNVGLYIDWMDRSLPQITDHETATVIKTKIQKCHRFLFLATFRGVQSKWCSWELGIAHSLKQEHELAILPIETRSGNWRETEYLLLYPEMNFETDNLDGLIADEVSITLNGTKIPLVSWLNA